MIRHLSLDGLWKLRWADGERGRIEYAERAETDPARYIDAHVPGEVHLDAWRVCLDLDGEAPLPDNFFDVFPDLPTVLPWPKSLGKPRVLYLGNLADENRPGGRRSARRV